MTQVPLLIIISMRDVVLCNTIHSTVSICNAWLSAFPKPPEMLLVITLYNTKKIQEQFHAF